MPTGSGLIPLAGEASPLGFSGAAGASIAIAVGPSGSAITSGLCGELVVAELRIGLCSEAQISDFPHPPSSFSPVGVSCEFSRNGN